MKTVAADDAATAIRAGWDELAQARWRVARDRFAEALASEESPAALEGLSWAAWWLDDAAAVFDARERAYRLYRQHGDPAGAARMATWLAADSLDFRGAQAAANGWLRRAERLLRPLEESSDHGWLAFHAGYVAHARGNALQALELSTRTAEIGRRCAVVDLEMLGLALEGATLVACARVGEGMERLDEAAVVALSAEPAIPISRAWTSCFLVGACTATLDFERAREWCDRIAEFADLYGSRYMLAFCRAEYGAIDLWHGRWLDAQALLETSLEDFAATRPAWVGSPLALLAELRRRQGRTTEAARLLADLGPTTAAQLCRARIALDEGEPLEATELLERLLRQLPSVRKLDRLPLLEALVRARVAAGRLDEAAAAVAELRDVEQAIGTASMRAVADRAEAVLAASSGDHERARSLLEDAVDRFDRADAPFEAAITRVALSTTLEALGRATAAAREGSLAREALARLGVSTDQRDGPTSLDDGADPLTGITPRERDVLGLLVEGLTNKQIAGRLVVSEHTVHRHVTSILRKLDVPSRSAAAAVGARAGLPREVM